MNSVLVSYLSKEAFVDDRFCQCIAIAHETGLELTDAVQLLHAAIGPPPRMDWGLLGHPSVNQCVLLAVVVEEVAAAFADPSAAPVSASLLPERAREALSRWPNLLSVALFHAVLPCDAESLLRLMSTEQLIARLRAFALLLRSASRIG
ncbi:hypothetical protein [Variovorax boronicumulans]|uniref:hypothetical protein n=1 Tax=Variovorax boronicumulans TaxID=436515 RepID=UPI00339489DD